MRRSLIFPILLLTASTAFAQVPPGDPFDPNRHPNPIITYVDSAAFKTASFDGAEEALGGGMLGLDRQAGERESLSVAEGIVRKVRILGRNVDVTFYPVVRQVYKLSKGSTLTLHSFKNPKIAIPSEVAAAVLNEAAFSKPKNPRDARFGPASPPERSEVRGLAALVFENNGTTTVFWQERGLVHTATSDVNARELFRLIEDLL